MKKILSSLAVVLIICFSTSFGQQIKVLFLGNSFTYVYDVPGIFEEFAIEAGLNVYVDTYADPGIALGTWTGNPGHNLLSGSLAKINSQQWDYVIVQDNLGIWVGNSPFQEGYDDLVENRTNIKNNNPCTKIIYFAGWCPEGGVQSGDSETACASRIYSNLLAVNNDAALNEVVSPVGNAWNSFMGQYPGVDLYYSDNTHASIEGAYLAAATLFVSTLKKDVTQLSFVPTNWYDGSSLSSSVAANMRQTAWSTVTNGTYYTQTNLENYTPEIAFNSGTLSTSGYSNYQWYLNGSIIAGATSSTYIPSVVGMYMVVGYNGSGCGFSSFEFEVSSISTASIFENETVTISIYPNPVQDQLRIAHSGNNLNSIEIIDLSGKVLYRNESAIQVLDVSFLNKGIYFLRLDLDGKMTTHKIIKN